MPVPRFISGQEQTAGDTSIRCSLCSHACRIQSGQFGSCGIRGNKNGIAFIPWYGHITAVAMDPIEKKPLYHFRPGSHILSIGFSGCNMRCPFCQNWRISQNPEAASRNMKPADVIALALREMPEYPAVAYTYSEPLVHPEFLLDCMALAHKKGIANVLVTNGCITSAAAYEILSLTDAANIDLKCFSAENYSKVLGGNLDTVLEFIRLASSMNVHAEITTLVVPQFNDTDEELDSIAQFITGLDPLMPWHLSAYHPDYRWNSPPTSPQLLSRTAQRSRSAAGSGGLKYVYTGNISGEANDTFCPHCGAPLVRRRGYSTDTAGLAFPAQGEKQFRCAQCGESVPVVH